MAIEQLDGKRPELYVNDLVNGKEVLTGREAVVLELLSRYHNPDFIKAMKAEGYDGARYFSQIADNQFGWTCVSDVVTADDWKDFAEVYLNDKYRLAVLRKFFERQNPHALQNIASRILETHRKGLRTLDDKTLQSAARVYVAIPDVATCTVAHLRQCRPCHAGGKGRRHIESASRRYSGAI